MVLSPVAVVVGGSRGIGLAVSQSLAKSGYRVGVLSRQPPAATGVGNESLIHQHCDVRQGHQHIAESMHELHNLLMGPPSVFVYAAGVRGPDSLIASGAHLDEPVLNDIFQTNVYGCISACKIVSREMIRNGVSNGSMILIGSIAGHDGIPGQSMYASSKSALIGLTKSLAKELGRRKIRVNLVSPGFIVTDMTKDLHQDDQLKKRILLQRLGTPQDVANIVNFLASESSDYITGQVFRVDGGLSV